METTLILSIIIIIILVINLFLIGFIFWESKKNFKNMRKLSNIYKDLQQKQFFYETEKREILVTKELKNILFEIKTFEKLKTYNQVIDLLVKKADIIKEI